jgi:hypothetical protein
MTDRETMISVMEEVATLQKQLINALKMIGDLSKVVLEMKQDLMRLRYTTQQRRL